MTTSMARRRPTRIGVTEVRDGTARVTHLEPGDVLLPRVIGIDGVSVTVALIGHTATMLAGDRVEIDIEIGAGVSLTVVEPAGTVAYNARGGRAEWSARVRVGADGRLCWAAAPLVVASGADLARSMDLRLADRATALLSELLVLGRSAEVGGAVRSRQSVWCGSTPLLIEDLDLRDPVLRSRPGILGDCRVLGTVGCYGRRPAVIPPAHGTELAGPGALVRVGGHEAHEVQPELDRAWAAWQPGPPR